MCLTVSLGQRSYPIHIAPGLLHQTGALLRELQPRRWAILADQNVAALYAPAVEQSLRAAGLSCCLYDFPAGEGSKCLATYETLCRRLMGDGFARTDGILALGGGVTGDLAGFIAATLLRGVTLAQLPTSLLSQVDSSVGGKTGLDLPEGKNLIGSFYQPALVLIDTDTLDTLPPGQLACGMAEVIKYGVIADAELFHHIAASEQPDFPWLVRRCCACKAALVAEDERDHGRRRLLNFGHTYGHAYEAAGDFSRWSHGQAVAAGMLQMLRWQQCHDLGGGELAAQLTPLLQRFGLPTQPPQVDLARYLLRDKKRDGEQITIAIAPRLGEGQLLTVPLAQLLEVAP